MNTCTYTVSCPFLGSDEGVWHIDLKNAPGSSGAGEPKAATDVTFSLKDTDFHKMFEGK